MPPAITWRVVSSPPMRISRVSPMHVLVGQPLAVDLGVEQDADEVVRRACRARAMTRVAYSW